MRAAALRALSLTLSLCLSVFVSPSLIRLVCKNKEKKNNSQLYNDNKSIERNLQQQHKRNARDSCDADSGSGSGRRHVVLSFLLGKSSFSPTVKLCPCRGRFVVVVVAVVVVVVVVVVPLCHCLLLSSVSDFMLNY